MFSYAGARQIPTMCLCGKIISVFYLYKSRIVVHIYPLKLLSLTGFRSLLYSKFNFKVTSSEERFKSGK